MAVCEGSGEKIAASLVFDQLIFILSTANYIDTWDVFFIVCAHTYSQARTYGQKSTI